MKKTSTILAAILFSLPILLFANGTSYCDLSDNNISSILNKNWPSFAHDYSNSGNNVLEYKLSPLSIKTIGLTKTSITNVPQYPNDFYYLSEALGAGIVDNNTAYIADAGGGVTAIDVRSGNTIFSNHVSNACYYVFVGFDCSQGLPNGFFSFLSTPVVTSKYLFVADVWANLYKLDRNTGKTLATVQLGGPKVDIDDLAYLYYTGQHQVFNINGYESEGDINVIDRSDEGKAPLVVVGLSSQAAEDTVLSFDPTRGTLVGINADTMKIEWKAYMTSDQFLKKPKWGGGVSMWFGMAIDKKRHTVYIGTGQHHTAPPPYQGSPSDNTPDLSDSIVAVNYSTGKIVDHFQLNAGDTVNPCYATGSIFCDPSVEPAFSLTDPNRPTDLGPYIIPSSVNLAYFKNFNPNLIYNDDVSSAPQLFTAFNNGKKIDVVGIAAKDGIYYALDRDNLNHIIWQAKPVYDPVIDQGIKQGGDSHSAAIDYKNRLIWYPIDVISADFSSSYGYIEAIDMDTGKIKSVLKPDELTNDSISESISIANNVLYVPSNAGKILMYDITDCCDAKHAPQLIFQDTVLMDPITNSPTGISRAPAIVDGKIYINNGNPFIVGGLGGLTIYQLKH